MRYSSAPVETRLEAILDRGTRQDLDGEHARCALLAAAGCIDGKRVWIAATDASRARGAIGVTEAARLGKLLRAAREAPAPVFLLLDSAGAKVDEGLAALGAFRRLYREALTTRLAAVPMYALLGRACFGGSSMLATLCNLRVYCPRTLLGVSGPGVIQALAGSDQLDATDPAAVEALMGGAARTQLGYDDVLVGDDLAAFRSRASELAGARMAEGVSVYTKHEELARRLGAAAGQLVESDEARRKMHHLTPSGYVCSARGDVIRAIAPEPRGQPALVGVLNGAAIGAAACWVLADELLRLHESYPGIAVILVLDATGHATTRHDEELLLSDYITHFALTAAWLATQNHRVLLWIPGHAAGAVYVAFAAPAEHVSVLPSAQIRILPQAAVQQILGAASAETSDPPTWLRAGVADALLDRRLASYADMFHT